MKKLLLLSLLFFLFCTNPPDPNLPTVNAIWTQHDIKEPKPEARDFCGFAYNDNGNKAFVFGGHKQAIYNLESTWEYDVVNKVWSEYNTEGTRPSYRYAPIMLYVENNKIILFGGMHAYTNDDHKPIDDVWEYDTINHIWTEIQITGDKPTTRVYSDMVYVGNNKIIMFGGYSFGIYVFYNDTWEFDTIEHKWTEIEIVGDKPSRRKNHKMVYLGNGKIVMYGGWLEDCTPCGTWIYEVDNKIWREIEEDRMPEMLFHSAAYIGDNKAIFFGGLLGGFSNKTYLFDGTEEKWYKVKIIGESIPEGRIEPVMTYNASDGAFMFGGSIDCGDHCLALNDVWEFSLVDNSGE